MKHPRWLYVVVLALAMPARAEVVTPVDRLTPGMSATIRGTVTRILDEDTFRIEDDTGSIRVTIGWKNRATVPVGESVLVRGLVDDGAKARLRPGFYASQMVRADGTVIDLHPPGANRGGGVVEATSVGGGAVAGPDAGVSGEPVEVLTPIDSLERGITATIQGQVTRILDEDEFRMEDATGSIRVYIGWKNRLALPVGETVVVRGFVDNDLVSFFRPEFYATEITRADGTVIRLN